MDAIPPTRTRTMIITSHQPVILRFLPCGAGDDLEPRNTGHPLVQTARWLLPLLSLVTACAGDTPQDVFAGAPYDEVEIGSAPALGSISIPVESEIPLEFRHLVALGSGLYAAAADRRPELWVLEPGTGEARMAAELDPSGRASIKGIAPGATKLGVLLSTGRLMEVDRASLEPLATLDHPSGPGAQMTGVYGLPDGGWAVLAQEMTDSPGSGDRGAMMVLHRLHGSSSELMWEEVKWTGVPSGDGVYDMMSLSGSGDTVLLSGTMPPRLIRIPGTHPPVADTLQGAPERSLTSADMQQVRQMRNRLPSSFRSRIAVPSHYPQVVRAWRHGDGILVLAGGPGRSVVLDWYCGRSFERTVAASEKMLDVGYFDDTLSILEEFEWGNRLSFYAIDQFGLSCH